MLDITPQALSLIELGKTKNPRKKTTQNLKSLIVKDVTSELASVILEEILKQEENTYRTRGPYRRKERNQTALGDQLLAYRSTNDLTQKQLAAKVGVSIRTIAKIERGERLLGQTTISKFETFFSHNLGINYLARTEIQNELQNNGQWWSIVLDENLSLGEKFRRLRLTDNSIQRKFARRSQVAKRTISRLEHAERLPRLRTINLLLAAKQIEDKDKIAQCFRLYAEQMPLMDIKKLERCPSGEVLMYCRMAQGMSRDDVADKLSISRQNIRHMEINKYTIDKNILNALLKELGLADHPVGEIIRRKENDEAIIITPKLAQQLVRGNILFAEYVEDIRRYLAIEPENA